MLVPLDPLSLFLQPSVSQRSFAAGCSSRVGEGESPLLGARSKTTDPCGCVQRGKRSSFRGVQSGFWHLLEKKGMGETAVWASVSPYAGLALGRGLGFWVLW